MKLGLVTFAAPPASGGGAVYVELLAAAAEASADVDEFHFFCERLAPNTVEPMSGSSTVRMHRAFARRATKQSQSATDYVLFGVQQLDFVRLAKKVSNLGLDGLLVHSSIAARPTLLPILLRTARRAGTHVTLDVRDIGLGAKQRRIIESFDSVLACGEGPRRQIVSATAGTIDPLIVQVPFAPSTLTESDKNGAASLLASLGVDGRFVLMTGGLTESKGAAEAARTALELARISPEPLPILACGPERVRDAAVTEARDGGALVYAGRVDPGVHLALLAQAACVASFSIREGLPRTLLEAMAHRRPFFAPSCVPEFEALPQLLGSPHDKARQIMQASGEDMPPDWDYDLRQHDPNQVMEQLVQYFENV